MMDSWQADRRAALSARYRAIREQHRPALLRGGTGDVFLRCPAKDTRMALALIIRVPPDWANAITAHLAALRKTEPDLYYYPPQDMHITVLDILRGEPDRRMPDNIDAYVQAVGDCVRRIGSFSIRLDGLTASDAAIMVQGFDDRPDLTQVRAMLRRELPTRQLICEERYLTDLAHITAVRIPDRLRCPDVCDAFIERPASFGVMPVRELELVFHNWYGSRRIVKARFSLT